MSEPDTHGFDIERLTARFHEKFEVSDKPPEVFYAPGRVNLIGDHTDYTGGLVFPCGIDTGSLLLIRRTHDRQFRLASTNFDLLAALSESHIGRKYGDNWINYPLGVVDQFIKRGFDIDGMDCLYSGNVPNGAGLSSSASIEVVTAFAINECFDCGLSILELINIAQAAENEFVGMQCGIMDQFAVAMARPDHALLLDCSTLDYRQVPLELGDMAIVLANTNQRRELNESAYNNRVAECNRALSLLQQVIEISELGQLDPLQLSEQQKLFDNDKVAYRRAMHMANENARVRAAVPALEQGDLAAFGELMNASHDSLAELFGVSSEPLEHLVRVAREQQGVLGSRLTGAGFGGCTVNLLPAANVDAFKERVGKQYEMLTGLTADFYNIRPGNGVHRVTL